MRQIRPAISSWCALLMLMIIEQKYIVNFDVSYLREKKSYKFYFFSNLQRRVHILIIMRFVKKIYSIPWSASTVQFFENKTCPHFLKIAKEKGIKSRKESLNSRLPSWKKIFFKYGNFWRNFNLKYLCVNFVDECILQITLISVTNIFVAHIIIIIIYYNYNFFISLYII